MVKSFLLPLKGPLIQTQCPVRTSMATSYLTAGPWNFCENHVLLKGLGSWIRQSVPSTDTMNFNLPPSAGNLILSAFNFWIPNMRVQIHFRRVIGSFWKRDAKSPSVGYFLRKNNAPKRWSIVVFWGTCCPVFKSYQISAKTLGRHPKCSLKRFVWVRLESRFGPYPNISNLLPIQYLYQENHRLFGYHFPSHQINGDFLLLFVNLCSFNIANEGRAKRLGEK